MKKLLYIILPFAAAALIFAGCDGQDATYKDFQGDGPIVYIGKPDSVKVHSGRGRLMVAWLEQSDPRAKKAKIYWANRTEQRDVALVAGQRTEVVIEDLEEGSYVFEIFTSDDHGNSSIEVEAVGTVYGQRYENTLMNRSVSAFSYNADTETATITFRKSPLATLEATHIVYRDGTGEQTFVMEKGVDRAVITPYVGGEFRFRAVYKPDALSIDEFYSPYEEYSTPSADI